MHKSLKLKIQNAINFNTSAVAESPAIFVGGRRRNRKKRKIKNVTDYNGGPCKRRGKKSTANEPVATPTAVFTYDDHIEPVYNLERPIVSCLDIREPVFNYKPVTSQDHVTKGDSDSMYNSSESIESYSSRRDSGCEQDDSGEEIQTDDQTPLEESVVKKGLARVNSKDSGVFYDDSADDAGYDDEIDDDVIEDVKNKKTEADIDTHRASIQVEEAATIESVETEIEPPELIDEPLNIHTDKFDEIRLDEEDPTLDDPDTVDFEVKLGDTSADTVDTDLEDDVDEEMRIVRQISRFSESDNLLKLVKDEKVDEEEDIIFDLSQLELNNTQEDISTLKQAKIKFQLEDKSRGPTGLEEGSLIRVPMDLLIDDNDKDDEVLFDARSRDRKQVSITCNPLYEQVLKEEEDKLSIKSFQSGFTTHFDNINYIQIPGTASNKAAHRETTPLLSRPPPGGEKDDELACCVIL